MATSTHDRRAQVRLTAVMIGRGRNYFYAIHSGMPDVPDELAWKLGARLPGHDYRIFTTAFVEATNPRTGAHKRFSLIHSVDWVNVIALTADQRVVLIRQFRPGVERVCLEIPGGMIEPGEDPCTAAARELAEETGYTGGTLELLGKVAPNPAIQSNALYTVLARGVALTGPASPDDGEVLSVETASLAECQRRLVDGEIDHALVVVAFAHLALRRCDLSA
jgi:8-oxo-dGTP pyrophosphatase MutT (NUDIX family)